VVICEERFVDRVRAAGGRVAHIVCVDAGPAGTIPLAALTERGDPAFDLDAAWRAVTPDDVLTLNYTSGSTGPPKGVEVTHRGMLAHIRGVHGIGMRYAASDRTVSYLPMAHLGDRGNSHYSGMVHGFGVTSVADLSTLPRVWPDTRPTLWIAVPRILEKVKAAVETRLAAEPDPDRRVTVARALETGLRKVRAEQAAITGTGPGPDVTLLADVERADAEVWSGVRERHGLDRVRLAFTGAAPAMIDVLEFFAVIGIPIGEVWGCRSCPARPR
jgi:long-subunit acyl-CoA synthetase (AMP-forming)